jgi:hypothetical protein
MTQKKIELQDKDVEEVKLCLSRNTFIPDIIRTKILGLCDLFEVTKEREIKRKETLDRLKEAQGLKPISERGGQNQPSENAPTEQNKFKNRFHKNGSSGFCMGPCNLLKDIAPALHSEIILQF